MRKNEGKCELCGQIVLRAQAKKHATACAPSHDASEGQEMIVQLQVEAAGAPEYWLLLEGRERASLQQVDSLLRSLWLECCGHLSAFRVARVEVAKRTALGQLPPAARLDYDYDFGSTTALKVRVVGARRGSLGRRAVRLVARNTSLPWTCETCEAPAVVVCPVCVYSGPSLFCRKHSRAHPCDEEGVWMPVVNSPRMGVCGYTG
jgi:hypothetical protein